MSAAEAVLGRGRKRQPDWFLEAENSLRPAKRAAHDRLLHTDNTSNRREFRKHQRVVARAVVEAKERWIKSIASTAELARRDGKQRWKRVRELQLAFAGRKATRPTALFKEDGVEMQGPDEVKQRWHGHFKKILNIPSQYQQEVVDSMPTHQTIYDLDDPLSALGKLKNGKVGGNTGILPELIRAEVGSLSCCVRCGRKGRWWVTGKMQRLSPSQRRVTSSTVTTVCVCVCVCVCVW